MATDFLPTLECVADAPGRRQADRLVLAVERSQPWAHRAEERGAAQASGRSDGHRPIDDHAAESRIGLPVTHRRLGRQSDGSRKLVVGLSRAMRRRRRLARNRARSAQLGARELADDTVRREPVVALEFLEAGLGLGPEEAVQVECRQEALAREVQRVLVAHDIGTHRTDRQIRHGAPPRVDDLRSLGRAG
jgi:hypothetical protein